MWAYIGSRYEYEQQPVRRPCTAAPLPVQVGCHLGEALMELYGQLGEHSGPDPARIRFDVAEGPEGSAQVGAVAEPC